jgi:hypothetical protein
MFHDRPKYIEIKHYILHDEVQKREVVLQYISTDEQITDILVKPLSKMKSLRSQERSWGSWRRIPYWKRKRLLPGWEGALICY